MPTLDRPAFVAAARQRVAELHHRHYLDLPIEGLCGFFAMGVIAELSKHGIRGCLQAGTASWPLFDDPADDDGVSPTHFSYEWEEDSFTTKIRLAQGLLPELHCWVGIPETQEIIDVTTRFLASRASMAGLVWRATPLDYVWCHATRLPPRVRYVPAALATYIAGGFLEESFARLAK